jgi:hypothetical protein
MSTISPGLHAPVSSSEQAARRIGGWLVPAIICLIISCFAGLIKIMVVATEVLPPSPPGADGPVPHPTLWTVLTSFDLAARIVLFFTCILLLVLLFKKRPVVPRFAVWFWAVSFAVTLVSLIWAIKIGAPGFRAAAQPGDADGLIAVNAMGSIRTGILALGWISYFLTSQRVKETFLAARQSSAPVLRWPVTPVEVAANDAGAETVEDEPEIEDPTGGMGYVAQRSLKASPVQIKRAADSWADCLGWHRAQDEDGCSVFRWERFARFGGTFVKVIILPQGDTAQVRFWIFLRDGSGRETPIRRAPQEYMSVIQSYADGVGKELALMTKTLPPADSEQWALYRDKLGRRIRLSDQAMWLLLVGAVPFGIIAGLLSGNTMWGFAAGGWLLTGGLVSVILLARGLGMRATGYVPLTIFFGFGATLFTVFAVFA